MKVLVTGAEGMLGFALRESCPTGVTFVGVDVDDCDVTDAAAVNAMLQKHAPDAVIHGAAFTDVDGCEDRERIALRVNGDGAGNVAQACRAAGIPLVHVSTDYVFDGTLKAPGEYAEEDRVAPLSAYGRTKLAGEVAVREEHPRHWIVRTQWLYGIGGKNFVETMLTLAGQRDQLAVVDDQIGSPTSTHDLAPALWTFVTERPPFGTYHVRNDGECSWYDFAAEIFAQAGVEITLDRTDTASFARPAPRPARSVLSLDKTRRLVGVHMAPWQDALARYLARRAAATAAPEGTP